MVPCSSLRLGQATYEPGSPKLDINNPAACKSFQTGYQVCFAFLDFYQDHGGEKQFGKPISPFEFHENLIVQYFEKARFEWRADRPEGQRVVLSDLGRLYFNRLGEDQAQLRSIRPLDATISSILSLHARAFVKYAITQSSGQQTVYVLVQSQTGQPVAGANGMATIHFTDGRTEEYFFTTNSSGLGSFTFDFRKPGSRETCADRDRRHLPGSRRPDNHILPHLVLNLRQVKNRSFLTSQFPIGSRRHSAHAAIRQPAARHGSADQHLRAGMAARGPASRSFSFSILRLVRSTSRAI